MAIDKSIVCAFVSENFHNMHAGWVEACAATLLKDIEAWSAPRTEPWPDTDDGHRKAERWALSGGYKELARDTELANVASISAHKYWGFRETERIVCFLKNLGAEWFISLSPGKSISANHKLCPRLKQIKLFKQPAGNSFAACCVASIIGEA